ncbi:MAG TPA: SCP2 sterol-binding domain-containing protein [Polyangiaceae bacterium]|jgi:putative sterol carrier protein|nr:SCP2 sterol-binding domain-containing protein [Polyangiaceae bacterium]
MTTTARDFIDQLRERLADREEAAKAIDAVYKFVLSGAGGGTWIIKLKDVVSISEGDGEAQCTIGLAASDFVDMFEGKVNGQQLFFAGKLNIEGDMQLALKLQRLTELIQE